MTVVSMALLLFFVLDPIGNIPIFLAALRHVPLERHRRIVLRECALACSVLVIFMLIGRSFLKLLHLSQTSLGIAGGIILFLIALRMIFPRPEGIFGETLQSEPLLFPLAIPTVAGPSALATTLLLVSSNSLGSALGALGLAMGLSTVILLSAGRIAKLAGPRVMTAVERLMGLILTAISVEMLLSGIRTFIESLRAA
ncbi:MAG TPA: MarC family protein [Chthoniobacteraceae bacterium]|nr:MarC family protein [Chthoniobacteraceae bacterium]